MEVYSMHLTSIDTFEITFTNSDFYRIVHQPEISFSYYNILDNISIHSISYPDSRPAIIWLRGDQKGGDDRFIQLYPNHLKALEKLCNIKRWRFVICI